MQWWEPSERWASEASAGLPQTGKRTAGKTGVGFFGYVAWGSEWEIVFWEEAANKMIVFIMFTVIFINFCVFLLIWINLKKM
jgi:hypothetical protein